MNESNITRMLEKAYDAYAPREIARLVEDVGVSKANLPALQTLTLAMLAGAFIAFGGMYYTMAVTESGLGLGPTRMLGGLAFALGLILLIIGGAELFTGNTLIVMAWAEGRVGSTRLLRNWALVYCGNFAGALGSAFLVHRSGTLSLGDGAVGETAVHIAAAKAELDTAQAFFRGLLCNALVCLATWLSFAARDVVGKILAILFPVSAFVALGFEHSGANMYLIPVGMLHGAPGVGVADLAHNLIPVTLGNIVGGALFVALVYWLIYVRTGAQQYGESDGVSMRERRDR